MSLDFNPEKARIKIEARTKKAQFLLNQQVIKDSNYYCPEDVGTLQDSAIMGGDNSTVEWDISYAKAQYYEDNNKSKDKNPNASMKWFEVAKSEKLKEWEKVANDEYNS